MKPSKHVPAMLALGVAAVALSPSAAPALTEGKPIAPSLEQQLATTARCAASPTIGNHVIALEDHCPNDPRITVLSLRENTVTAVATLPVPAGLEAWPAPYSLEAGTDAHGSPVVIVSSMSVKDRVTSAYLVRLDSGTVRRLRLRPSARLVTDVAIDAGRLYYLTTVNGETKRARARRCGPRG